MIYSNSYLRIRNIRTLALYFLPACFRLLLVNLCQMNSKISVERFASCHKNIHWVVVIPVRPCNDTYNLSGYISSSVALMLRCLHIPLCLRIAYRRIASCRHCHIHYYNCPYIPYSLGRTYPLV
jgi:hypothetical protein